MYHAFPAAILKAAFVHIVWNEMINQLHGGLLKGGGGKQGNENSVAHMYKHYI